MRRYMMSRADDCFEPDTFPEQDHNAQVMTVLEFWSAVKIGAFTEDDGVGYYGTDKVASSYSVWVTGPDCAPEHTHVHWFNK